LLFSFELPTSYHPEANNPLSQAISDMVLSKREILSAKYEDSKDQGFLGLLVAQTGLGKTYNVAAFIVTDIVRAAAEYAVPMNAALSKLDELAKIESATLKSSGEFDPKFGKNERYSSYMKRIATKAKRVNKNIQESSVPVSDKELIKSISDQVIAISQTQVEVKQTVVSTDLTNNVHNFFIDVIEHIKNDTRLKDDSHRNFVKSLVFRALSNSDHLMSIDPEDVKMLVEIADSGDMSISRVYKKYLIKRDSYESLLPSKDSDGKKDYKVPPHVIADIKKELVTVSGNFYRSLLRGLSGYRKNQMDSGIEIPPKVMASIDKVFPSTRIINGDVVCSFMTTKKYMKPMSAFPTRFNFKTDLPCHRLYLDESDKQNAVIRDELIDGKSINLIRTIKASRQIETTNTLEKGEDFNGVSEKIQKAYEKIEDAYKKWGLEKSFDVVGGEITGDQISIFQAPAMTSTISINGLKSNKSDVTDWVNVQLNKNRNMNELLVTEKPQGASDEDKSDTAFPYIFNQINYVCWQFLKTICNSAKKLTTNRRKRAEERGEPTGGISIIKDLEVIIHQYGLESIRGVLYDYLFSFSNSSIRYKDDETPFVDLGFHVSGFCHNRVTRHGASYRTVEFNTFNLPISATGVLASLVSNGTEVLLMSATAKAETMLHNFDLKFAKKALGEDKYLEMNSYQMKACYEYYKDKRNYEAHGSQIKPYFLPSAPSILKEYVKENVDGGSLQLLFERMYPADDESKDNSSAAGRERTIMLKIDQMSKLVKSMQMFIESDHNRYMLGLMSRFVGSEKNPLEREFIESVVNWYSGKKGISVSVECSMSAEKLKVGDFDDALKGLASGRVDKLIILSSYQTMGAGINAYYVPEVLKDIKSLVYTDDTLEAAPSNVRADIDTIYLDRPTNLFPVLGDHTIKVIDFQTRVSCEYNIMALLEANIMAPAGAKYWIKKILGAGHRGTLTSSLQSAYMSKSDDPKNSFCNSTDYCNAVIRCIEQAVGRMSRTAYKRPEILILADSQLEDILAIDDRPIEALSHEYVALREVAKSAANGKTTFPYEIPGEVEHLQKTAILSNKASHRAIKQATYAILSNSRYKESRRLRNINEMCEELNNLPEFISFDDIKEVVNIYSQKSIDNYLNVNEKVVNIRGYNGGFYDSIFILIEDFKSKNKESAKAKISILNRSFTVLKNALDENEKPVKVWNSLREVLLKYPTMDSAKSVDEVNMGHMYIEVPDGFYEDSSYDYAGVPEYQFIDSYQFFEFIKKNKSVISASEASLIHIISNPVVMKHFVERNFATTWKFNKFMMAPVVFTNIYRPAVSEQAVEAILVDEGFTWHEIPNGLEEKMDGIIEFDGRKALLDVKFWRKSRPPKPTYAEKLQETMTKTNIDRVVYVNMLDELSDVDEHGNKLDTYYRTTTEFKVPEKSKKGNVLFVSGVMRESSPTVIRNHIEVIKKFLTE